MVRGLISGLIWGCLVAGIATIFLSLYAPLPQIATPEAEAEPEETETSQVDPDAVEPASSETTVADPGQTTGQTTEQTTGQIVDSDTEGTAVATPAPSGTTETESEETADAGAPASSAVAQTDAEPEVQTDATPVETTQTVTAPAAAQSETAANSPNALDPNGEPDAAPQIATATEAPALPAADPGTGTDVDIATDDVTKPELDLEVATLPEAPAEADAPLPRIGASTEAGTQIAGVEPKRLTVPSPSTGTAPETGSAPEPFKAPVQSPATEAASEDSTQVAANTPIGLDAPIINNPVGGVVTNRLPSLRVPSDPVDEGASVEEGAVPAALDPNEVGALAAFRAATEVSPNASLFSIILIDVGVDGMPRDQLLELGLPLTIALDPTAPNADAAMQAYRAAGYEIAVLPADLPTDATASDVEVALGAYFDVVSEAVAILDPLDGRIQGNRNVLDPVLGSIGASGHGFITYDRGLNSAQKAARRENIPEATVFRVLDGDLESSDRIKRYLDRAAFTANKDGHVVVLGRSYPETVKALLEWGLARKDGDLALVPISVVMGAGS